jgi:hypothetical protein
MAFRVRQRAQCAAKYSPVEAIPAAPGLCEGSEYPLTCWPNALCGFVFRGPERAWELAIAWEFYRATESHRQIREKLDGYIPRLHNHAYRRALPQAVDTRILFIVPSIQRRQNLIESLHGHPSAAFVRLEVFGELTALTALHSPLWFPLDGTPPRPIIGATDQPLHYKKAPMTGMSPGGGSEIRWTENGDRTSVSIFDKPQRFGTVRLLEYCM